nr:hypothetical protein [Bacteroidota bacterium]
MEKMLSKFVSFIFHPLAITAYYLLITLNLHFYQSMTIPTKARLMILGLVLITTLIIPALMANLFSKMVAGKFKMEGREKKFFPLSVAAVFYFITYYLLNQIKVSPVFDLFLLGMTSLAILSLIITLNWEISIYMCALGGLFGAFLSISVLLNMDLILILIPTLLISGIVGYARLTLTSHTPIQIYGGFLMGAGVMFLHFFYL